MRRSTALLALLTGILLVTALVGCATDTSTDLPPPTQDPDAGIPVEVFHARDAVIEFMREGAILCVPPENAVWYPEITGDRVPTGFEVYDFTAEECVVTVTYPQEPAGDDFYHVALNNAATGCCWQAMVDSAGHIVKTGNAAAVDPENNPAAIHCKAQGHSYEIRIQDECECGFCVFEDGSTCNAWAFFRGGCGPETSTVEQ